jgi:hypothetical protein
MKTKNQQNQRETCRWKRMPPRDEHGHLRVTYEFRPATSVLDRERFDDLARMLYQRWVLEPAPWESSEATTISPSTSTPSLHSESTHV